MVMARRLGRFVGRSFVARAFNALVTLRIAYLARRAYTVLAVTSLIIGSLIALNYSPLIWRRVSEHFALYSACMADAPRVDTIGQWLRQSRECSDLAVRVRTDPLGILR